MALGIQAARETAAEGKCCQENGSLYYELFEALPCPPEKSPNQSPSNRSRILLAEDYAANVLVATTYLEEFDYEYDLAGNGMEAIEKVRTGEYAAILMDVQMYGINGFEATRLIREYEKQTGKPRMLIIGMTAHALAGDRERCLSAGMDDYISKPFNPDVLKDKLALARSTEVT